MMLATQISWLFCSRDKIDGIVLPGVFAFGVYLACCFHTMAGVFCQKFLMFVMFGLGCVVFVTSGHGQLLFLQCGENDGHSNCIPVSIPTKNVPGNLHQRTHLEHFGDLA